MASASPRFAAVRLQDLIRGRGRVGSAASGGSGASLRLGRLPVVWSAAALTLRRGVWPWSAAALLDPNLPPPVPNMAVRRKMHDFSSNMAVKRNMKELER